MVAHQVDLIVVGANKLAARTIKKVMSEIAEGIKNFEGHGSNDFENDTRGGGRGSKNRGNSTRFGGDNDDGPRKEAFVIWGSLEIPKLFANSHQSKKMFKTHHPILK